jgi:DNA repair protein RadA/Sms
MEERLFLDRVDVHRAGACVRHREELRADSFAHAAAADLAVMLAITSSLRGKALPKGFLAFGEVGLAGEVRPAPRGQDRLKEAAKLGFKVAVVPKANAPKKNDKAFEGLTIYPVERIEEAMQVVRGLD